ncbi:hypothetical protein DMH01_14885 [Amycolatopsis sp. WAC 04182]|nr:hypothetical protein DMH01_14885 [Amycolatopsis sp. WAC 04182]
MSYHSTRQSAGIARFLELQECSVLATFKVGLRFRFLLALHFVLVGTDLRRLPRMFESNLSCFASLLIVLSVAGAIDRYRGVAAICAHAGWHSVNDDFRCALKVSR